MVSQRIAINRAEGKFLFSLGLRIAEIGLRNGANQYEKDRGFNFGTRAHPRSVIWTGKRHECRLWFKELFRNRNILFDLSLAMLKSVSVSEMFQEILRNPGVN